MPANRLNMFPPSTADLWDYLQQPSIVLPLALLIATIVYQSLHSNNPFADSRHSGELLWDLIITLTPARVLHTLDQWLHPPLFPVPESMRPARQATHAAKGDMLRRLLGMDNPNSIMNAVAHAGGRTLSSLSASPLARRQSDSPPGLGNYDNSCFQNSILQSLASLKPLSAYLTSALAHPVATTQKGEFSTTATLRDLLSRLTDSEHDGTTLWTPKQLKSLDTWQQQDAQEYFSKILDEIDKEVTLVARAQQQACGLETASLEDDTVESQHSDDSGYQSQSAVSKSSFENKMPRNPLEGLVAQRVACVQCGHSEGLSMIPFNCITLSLGLTQGAHDLFERLDSYTDLESIEGVECAKCSLMRVERLLKVILDKGLEMGKAEDSMGKLLFRLKAIEAALEEDDFEEKTLVEKCKIPREHRTSTTKTKQMVVARPPQSLAIHINRSVFDEHTGQMFKNLATVQFPSTLDLGPWCLGSAGPARNVNPVDPESEIEERWSSDPRSSMVSGDLRPSQMNGPIYELRAVVTHQGRHENGHYVCYRKHPIQQHRVNPEADEESKDMTHNDAEVPDDFMDADNLSKWWRLSDESVWEVSEDSVLAQGGVFMLFYDCVDPHSVLRSRSQALPPVGVKEDATSNYLSTAAPLDASVLPPPEDQEDHHDAKPSVGVIETLNDYESLNEEELSLQTTCQQPPNLVSSCLIPLLKQDELVDATIPIAWPNCR